MASILIISNNNLQLLQFHEANRTLVDNINKNPIIIQALHLEHTPLLNKIKLLALSPCVLQSIRKYLPIFKILRIFSKLIFSCSLHLIGILAVI